nr:MAG TPA: endolysin [Caudoviricetes sp.]
MSLLSSIKENEGFDSHVYEDTRGFRTVGYGFKVSSLTRDELALNGGKVEPMSREVADQILNLKIKLKFRSFCK